MDDTHRMERAYELKIKCLNKLKKADLAQKASIELADYFYRFAEKVYSEQTQGALRAESFFNKAIFLYRNNNQPIKAEEIHRRLVEVQRDKVKSLQYIKQTIDLSKIIENITKNMQDLSFSESIIRLAQFTHFYKRNEVQETILEEIKEFPLSHLFAKTIMNEEGQTILTLPPLSLSNPLEDDKLIELHIHNKLLELQTFAGDMVLRFALSYIREKFDICNEDMSFLIEDNILIPCGRHNVIRKAIYSALEGCYYEAIHILAPQTENLFRNIAKEVGGLTVTLENDGSSKEKVLSSIFDLPELIDCYDNDILFLFKSLLNEQAGANIRNKTAHGIMNESNGNGGVCIYFICAVIKLLVMSSPKCGEITMNSEALKKYVLLEKDSIKIKD